MSGHTIFLEYRTKRSKIKEHCTNCFHAIFGLLVPHFVPLFIRTPLAKPLYYPNYVITQVKRDLQPKNDLCTSDAGNSMGHVTRYSQEASRLIWVT